LTENETKWKYDGATQWWKLLQNKLAANKQRSDVRRLKKGSVLIIFLVS
jgi:hypothetical protein